MSDNEVSIVSINSDENDLDVESYQSNIKKNKQRYRSRNRSYSRDKKRAPKGTGIYKADYRFRKNYKNYSIEYKRNILALVDKGHSLNSISEEKGIPLTTLSTWKKNKLEIYNSINKRNKIKIISNGKNPQTIEIDDILAKWIKDLRDEKIPVQTNDIIIKATELYPEFKNKSLNALKLWCTRFLRRMGFSIRKIGHYAQKPKDNVVNFIKEFILYKNKIIFEYNLENNEKCIGNADETPIWLEPVDNKTVDIIGNKDIHMITFGKDKERVSVMLTVLGN